MGSLESATSVTDRRQLNIAKLSSEMTNSPLRREPSESAGASQRHHKVAGFGDS